MVITSIEYPRPLHPGGFPLPPLVEDRLSIVTTSTRKFSSNHLSPEQLLQTNLLLVKPTNMESFWEWYAYTNITMLIQVGVGCGLWHCHCQDGSFMLYRRIRVVSVTLMKELIL